MRKRIGNPAQECHNLGSEMDKKYKYDRFRACAVGINYKQLKRGPIGKNHVL